nr:zf-CCHC domain-containing protein/UBN2 domain-containing protein [Tanacetum cinerariifolium]
MGAHHINVSIEDCNLSSDFLKTDDYDQDWSNKSARFEACSYKTRLMKFKLHIRTTSLLTPDVTYRIILLFRCSDREKLNGNKGVSQKSLDPDYSRKNHIKKFLRALPLKWRAKVTNIEEAKDLATLPLDDLVGNLKVYEMILENDGVVSKTTTKDKVKSLALKAKITREKTSDDSDSQDGSDEYIDEELESNTFNLMARKFCQFFHKGNQFGCRNRFSNNGNRFGKGRSNSLGNKGGESLKPKGACYKGRIEGHLASECRKPKENKDFVEGI